MYSAILFTVFLTGLTALIVAPHLKEQPANNQE
jgi:hypothetical protein